MCQHAFCVGFLDRQAEQSKRLELYSLQQLKYLWRVAESERGVFTRCCTLLLASLEGPETPRSFALSFMVGISSTLFVFFLVFAGVRVVKHAEMIRSTPVMPDMLTILRRKIDTYGMMHKQARKFDREFADEILSEVCCAREPSLLKSFLVYPLATRQGRLVLCLVQLLDS